MANSFIQNPFFINDTGTSYTGEVRITTIYWTGSTTGADLIIYNSAGRTICRMKSTGVDLQVQDVGIVNGIVPATIGSGYVYIYHS